MKKLKKLLEILTDRNAKARTYWKIMASLAIVNVAVSGYLLKLEHDLAKSDSAFCDLSDKFSCSTVAASKYSELLGLPVALWGLLAYILMAFMAFKFSQANKIKKEIWYFWLAFIAGSLAFSIYLTYVELFIIQSICIFCVTQQVVILIMAGLHWPVLKHDHRL